jgi:hypothetical protein
VQVEAVEAVTILLEVTAMVVQVVAVGEETMVRLLVLAHLRIVVEVAEVHIGALAVLEL